MRFNKGDLVKISSKCEDENLKMWDSLACNDNGNMHRHEVILASNTVVKLKGYTSLVWNDDIELIQ